MAEQSDAMSTLEVGATLREARMPKGRSRALVESWAYQAGISLDGSGPASIRVLNDAFYDAALIRGAVGLREAYVEGWWDAERLDVVTERVLSQRLSMRWADGATLLWGALAARLRNRQSPWRNTESARHYDLGNDLYQAMLDQRMVYTCAYWRGARTLDEAQEAKLDLVCRKLGLQPGMRVLDIGCGWGGFARFAAERYGATVVGITISPEQAHLATGLCAGQSVTIRLQDYRELEGSNERYDRIVSLGMLEHVGHRNYRRYMGIVRKLLVSDGLVVVQSIAGNQSKSAYDPWMNAHIFPNAAIPSVAQIAGACEGNFVLEDWHNIGPDYDPTLMRWHANFERNWPLLQPRYGDRFHRIWKCYLLTCAGSFRARLNQVWQIVLSPSGVPGGYEAVR